MRRAFLDAIAARGTVLGSILSLAILALFASACDDDIGRGERGRLLTLPRAQLAFGTIALGEISREEVLLVNEGTGPLTLIDIRWDGSDDIALEFPMGPARDVVLQPGADQTYTLVVAYSPRLGINQSGGDIVIESNDPDRPTLRLPVVTQELGARIQVTPSRTEMLNFGAVGLEETERRTVSITNVGILPLEITDIMPPANNEFVLDFPAGVTFPRPPSDPYIINDISESLVFDVVYTPRTLGQDLGEITILSNDPRDPIYRLPLLADSSAPCIRVSEELVEFSPAVAIGDVKTRSILIESCGGVPLTVAGIEKVPGGSNAIIKTESTPIQDLVLEPDQSVAFEVVYAPLAEGIDSAEFVVRSNDTLRPEVTVRVLGTGTSNVCPEAIARARIAGSGVLEKQLVAIPLDTVVLDGTQSRDPESTVTEWRWELRSRPTDSTATIEDRGDGIAQVFLDLAGDYEACLTVVDAQGTESCNEDCVQIRAQPNEKIHVQLVWHTPKDEIVGNNDGADVDLHFTRIPQGTWGDRGTAAQRNGWDIFFDNREATWLIPDGAPENPSLDRDDTDGEGPENVNLDDPNPCAWYAVGVHYFDDKGFEESYATVRIYINGQKRFEKVNIPLEVGSMATGDFWLVAYIHWDGSIARIFDAGERYFNGEWIGMKPSVPQPFADVIASSVPACAP